MKRINFVLILVLIILTAVVLVISYPRKEKGTEYCKVDEDCIPAQCCHPTDCVNVANKPNCKGIFCTMECKPGTMDCGNGYCDCVNNECKAIIG
jgi:hypothetical protein